MEKIFHSKLEIGVNDDGSQYSNESTEIQTQIYSNPTLDDIFKDT